MNKLNEYKLSNICFKTDFSYFSVSGDDSLKFLQSQFTNDISLLESGIIDHQLSGYCNPKGRLVALIRVLRLKESSYLLIMPHNIIKKVFNRLKLFILRAKVNLAVATNNSNIVGVYCEDFDFEVNKMLSFNDLYLLRDIDCQVFGPRAWLIGDNNLIKTTVKEINVSKKSQIIEVDNFTWKTSELSAGNLWIDESNSETFIPQSVNLDLNSAVSFTKGCYPGQEVVARTHYLGKVKRRLILVSVKQSKLKNIEIKKECPVFQKNLKNNFLTEVGQVVDISNHVTPSNEKKTLMLVQCHMNQINIEFSEHKLILAEEQGPELSLVELPNCSVATLQNKSKTVLSKN